VTTSSSGGTDGVRAERPAPAEAADHAATIGRLISAIGTAVLGRPEAVRLAVVALLCEGHILIEDVPGVGKTRLARAVAACVGGEHRRVQFTPDLLPSDLTGVNVFNQATREFDFHAGPVFANVVVADEINRAAPKTQSALLEAMEERLVTVDGVRYAVHDPFLIVATQNPVELDGTYRLPEAQLDRFLVRLSLGYPDEDTEVAIMRGTSLAVPERLGPVLDQAALRRVRAAVQRVHVSEAVYRYIAGLAAATRAHPRLRLGVSPRASASLARAARAYALSRGRAYVVPEDVDLLAAPVWEHRLVLTSEALVGGATGAGVLADVLAAVPAPQPERAAAR
jgi:MoxR-like ATPase